MQPSAAILDKIKHLEGFSATKYLDPPGNTKGQYSIGYGHLILATEKNLLSAKLSTAQAEAIFNDDIAWRIADINKHLVRPVSQDQFDALLSMHYNIPTGALAAISTWNSTGSVSDTTARMKLYNKAGGVVNNDLVARRNYEASLFSGANPVVTALAGMDEKKKP